MWLSDRALAYHAQALGSIPSFAKTVTVKTFGSSFNISQNENKILKEDSSVEGVLANAVSKKGDALPQPLFKKPLVILLLGVVVNRWPHIQ